MNDAATTFNQKAVQEPTSLLVNVPLTVFGLSVAYSTILGWLERRYPIKPDHTWAEVTGGVIITLAPVALTARKFSHLHWNTYETAVWRCFFASGMPIILWQLGEAVMRQIELMEYAARKDAGSKTNYADDTTTMAGRSRGRAHPGPWYDERSDTELANGAGEA